MVFKAGFRVNQPLTPENIRHRGTVGSGRYSNDPEAGDRPVSSSPDRELLTNSLSKCAQSQQIDKVFQMDEFPWMGAAFASVVFFFAVFMIKNVGKNVSEDIC